MEDERNTQSHQGGESQGQAADQVEVKDRGFLGKKKPAEDQEKQQEEELVTGIENVKVSEPATHDEVKKEEHHGGEKKESLLAKLHRTSSSSSSSSDEEEEEVMDEEEEEVIDERRRRRRRRASRRRPRRSCRVTRTTRTWKAASTSSRTCLPRRPAPAPPASVEAHAHHKVDDDHKDKAYIPPTAPAITTGTTAHVHHDDNAVVTQKVEETPDKGLLDKIKEKLPGGHKKQEDAVAAAHAPHATTEDGVSSPDGKEKKQGLLGKIMDKIPGYNKSPAEGEHKPATAAAGEHKTSSS